VSTVELRYLNVHWTKTQVPCSLTVAPQAIPIEIDPDGTMHAETEIFHDFFPTIGVHIETSSDFTPSIVTATGKRLPLKLIYDNQGRSWWIDAGKWDPVKRRFNSELFRSLGEVKVDVGANDLILHNVATGFGRSELDDLLRDFKGDLYWLLFGIGPATARFALSAPSQSIQDRQRCSPSMIVYNDVTSALRDLATAAERVASRPAQATREVTAFQPLAKLRPNAATYRHYLANPAAKRLPGRCAESFADIPDNRYIRHMVQTAKNIAEKMRLATIHQKRLLSERSELEKARAVEYRTTTSRAVDPDVFDRQLKEMEEVLSPIEGYSDGPQSPRSHPTSYTIEITGEYAHRERCYFYKPTPQQEKEDKRDGVTCRVVELPPQLHFLMNGALPHYRDYDLVATASTQRIGQGKKVRLLSLDHIVHVSSRTLKNKARTRRKLKENNWKTDLSKQEHEELKLEAIVAASRAEAYLSRSITLEKMAQELSILCTKLRHQDQRLGAMNIMADAGFPSGMRFSQNPNYAASLSAFRKLSSATASTGSSIGDLQAVDRIGIIHASALYEHWCMVKIIMVLIDDFQFVPHTGWEEKLIRALTKNREPVSVVLSHSDIDLDAQLDIQPSLPNGRRPDFRLIFSSSTLKGIDRHALVMDAKFRSVWKDGELPDTLSTLINIKRYGEVNNRVFILQPGAETVANPTTPLAWARDCDYGHETKVNHQRGHVRLSPHGNSSTNLKRLIALHLQFSLPAPLSEGEKRVCIGCGLGSTANPASKTGWIWSCAECTTTSIQTRCFACSTRLMKNGHEMTYHQTLADQITNVCCPNCGSHFTEPQEAPFRSVHPTVPKRNVSSTVLNLNGYRRGSV
jgi:Protein of unknown function (DUF524).